MLLLPDRMMSLSEAVRLSAGGRLGGANNTDETWINMNPPHRLHSCETRHFLSVSDGIKSRIWGISCLIKDHAPDLSCARWQLGHNQRVSVQLLYEASTAALLQKSLGKPPKRDGDLHKWTGNRKDEYWADDRSLNWPSRYELFY